MAQILDLGKVRFNWAGAYSPTVQYEYNDLVTYGPSLYAFTSTSAATGVEPTNTGSWTLVVEGFEWKGTYANSTLYFKNDVVTDGVSAYICTTKHTSADADVNDNENFSILALGQTDLPSQITAVNKVLSSNGIDPFWASTTYLTKGYWGAGQGQTAATVETASGYTNALTVWAATVNDFAQLAFTNTSNGADASADFIAYNDIGDNDSGFMDMGITSSQFSDPDFTITGANDGYIFYSAARGTQRTALIKQLLAGSYTITLDAAHGWTVGDLVRFEGVDADIDGQHEITAVPTGNSLSFAAAPGAIPYVAEEITPPGSAYRPVGKGNMVLATDASGQENKIIFAAGGFYSGNVQMQIIPDQQVHIEIQTESTNPTTGALVVAGGAGFTGNVNVDGYLMTNVTAYVGPETKIWETSAGLTDLMLGARAVSDSFAQVAIVNGGNGTESSTDFIAYSVAGDNNSGWIDMGITNPNFDSESYGITGPGDGYIFMSGVADKTSTVTAISVAGNVATFTTSSAHKGYVGNQVVVGGTNATFDGTYTITGTPTATTFTVAKTLADGTFTGFAGTAVIKGGTGNLVLATDGNGTENRIVFAAGGLSSGNEQMIIVPDQFVHVEIATQSTSPTTGALVVAGGIGLSGNLNVAGDVDINGEVDLSGVTTLPVGAGAKTFADSLTNPVVVASVDADDYAQIAFQNLSDAANASTDFLAYADNGDDNTGWIDLGITSSNFADPDFTITGANDGYIFMSAPAGTTGNGNLVLATDSTGEQNRIVFAAGGLSSNNTQMIIIPDTMVHVEIATQSTSPTTGALVVAGGLGVSGNVNVAGNVNIAGTISFGGSGTTVETENLAVTDPMIFVGTDNLTDSLDLTFIGEYAGPTTLDPTATVLTRARTNNVVTLGIQYGAGSPAFKVGDTAVIANSGIVALDGSKTLTAVTSNSISFASTGTDFAQEQSTTEYSATITNKALTSGVATLTAPSHGFTVGEVVTIAGVDATFNGTYTISGTTTNTFNYDKIASDVASTPATTAFVRSLSSRSITSNVASITTTQAHGYNIGESVVIAGLEGIDAVLNGTFTITATPSDTIFRFAIVAADILEGATEVGATSTVNRLVGTGKVYRVEGTANATDVFRPRWAGLSRDASAGNKAFKLFQGLSTKPTTTIDYANVDLSLAPLELAALTATGTVTANSVTATGAASSFSTITLTGTPSADTDAATLASVRAAASSWTIKTANYTAVDGDMLWLNTTGGVFTVTLPASPAVNARIRMGDVASTWDTNKPIVNRNGNLIMGLAENLTLDVEHAVVEFVYSGPTFGWRVF